MIRTGHQLKVARIAAGLTQDDLALGSGVSRQTVLRYEAMGKLPQGVHQQALTRFLMGLGGLKMQGRTMVVEVKGV